MWSPFVWTPELQVAYARGSGLPPVCLSFVQTAMGTWRRIPMALATGSPMLETTITDEILLELVARHPTDIRVRQLRAKEAHTGADWEWWVLQGGHGLPMRVQAKRLDAGGVYPEVGRRINNRRNADRQMDILIRQAAALRPRAVPLYCFYNWETAAALATGWARYCTPILADGIHGCTLASASAVEAALGTSMNLRLEAIAGGSLPWSDLVCCGSDALYSAVSALDRLGVQGPAQYISDELPDYVRATHDSPAFVSALAERQLAGVVVIELGEER